MPDIAHSRRSVRAERPSAEPKGFASCTPSLAQRRLAQAIRQSPRMSAQRQQLAGMFGAHAARQAPDIVQRTPPSGEDWEKVNQVVTALRTKDWVQSAFPVAQGSQVALKNINSEGICRTIVLEWFRQTKARKRGDYLAKFQTGEVDDLVAQDEEFLRQQAIFASRNAPDAPEKEQVDHARRYMNQYLSVGGSLMTWVVEDANPDSQAIVDAIGRNGFYYVIANWTEDGAPKSHALGVIKNGTEYYYLDPNHFEVKGTGQILELLRGLLDGIYGPKRKTNPTYGLMFAPGTIDKSPCFLTTAAVRARGLPDDCEELAALRQFRDSYLRHRADGHTVINHYYAVAPRILAAMALCENERDILEAIFGVIEHCVDMIRRGRNEHALRLYRGMVRQLEWLL